MYQILLGFIAAFGNFDAIEQPDVVVVNTTVHTLDRQRPIAEAFAVRDGKFTAVGTTAEVRPAIGPETLVLDLQGKTVVPGFIDAHSHPRPIYDENSRWYSIEAGPEKTKTIDDLIEAVRRKAKITPKGQWIRGFGYHETKLGRHPNRHDLDKATTDHPVVIGHSSGHLSVCNSLALETANIGKDTPNPAGGEFDRDANGELTGLLKETAVGIVSSRGGPRPEVAPENEALAAYKTCYRKFFRRGITGVHVAGTDLRTARLMTSARGSDAPLRLYIMLREGSINRAVELKKAMKEDEANVRYGAIKCFHGKSLTGNTAWLYEPYANDPHYFGIAPARSRADLYKLVARIHDAGLQCCMHSNGDKEIDMVLDAYEAALKANPRRDHRHRIEHCSVVNEAILKRIRKLELVIAPQSYVYEHGDKFEGFGSKRWDWMLPSRSLIDQGTVVAGNSDYPVSSADPLLHIHDMVNRTSAEGKVYGPKQCCTVEQALESFTLSGAYAEFAEKLKGTIEVGKLADFVVLAADPTRVDPKRIKDVEVLRTVIGGVTVFEKK